ncbi:3-phosphoshikimate 1-carboxyvinyltransferase [Bacteroidia bacterium]|nr:3-phosphoshikimate 1-carboxyvinyltransferase [Bacteroidia bacterium]GHT46723.1 3-phosphoshikimate 1-carboxyvinyltransferase [Bacteroidia bacterium]
MIYKIQASHSIHTSINLPASKSISNRALILNALAKSSYPVENRSDSDDTRVLFNALQSSGPDFDIGAAGTSMRFLTAYLSQLEGNWTITGSERMKNRPIGILVDALRSIGAEIEYEDKEGFPPLHIRGKKLKGGKITLNGGVSSQYISALMMIAPCLKQGLKICLEGNIISKPYIQMTKGLMEIFGVNVFWEGQNIEIEPQDYIPVPFQVESDWSAASYWYEIQALAPDASVELLGLEENSLQGDAKIETVMADLLRLPMNTVFQYDFTNEPDLAQTLVVTCCLLNIPFRFTGLQSLRIKETDRMTALQTELRKLGYIIQSESNSILEWTGKKGEPEPHPVIATYEDHRMAMAFAPVCLKTREIRIANPEVVSKSYPRFWLDLAQAGFIITEEP